MMSTHARAVQDALETVRRRWRMLAQLRLVTRLALGAAVLWLVGLALTWAPGGPALLVAVAGAALLATVGWVGYQLARRPAVPRDTELARLLEERCPELEDRVASAVDLQRRAADAAPALADALMADAARVLEGVTVGDVVPRERVRAAAWRAAAAVALCAVVVFVWWGPGRRAYHAAQFYLFPERFVLDVTPGDARVHPGEPLTIRARTSAARGGVTPELTVRVGDEARTIPMAAEGDETFSWAFDPVPGSFTYHVSAAGRASQEFTVTLLEVPRVRQIDLRYTYPAFTKLAPRLETDGGDIYAPAGTGVQVTVHPSGPIASGTLTLGDTKVPLVPAADGTLVGDLRVEADGSYRVALADVDGLTSPGDTEYFVRVLNDRPPDVRILRPAGDRDVTPLEEITVEARAEDDYGLGTLELVYSVRGERERTVRLEGERTALTALGRYTLHLEELDVSPGDFVTYYARVRDIGRGRRSTEARSDIFFLEVKPFEEEFAAAQSQAMAGGGGDRGLDDLVSAQKEIIVATWKLERRSGAGRSPEDVRAIGTAQGELRGRAARAASQGRDTRRRFRPPSPDGTSAVPAEPMAQAVVAMGRAEESLKALKLAEALPNEMEALNHLLRAQAEVRRREVARQQASGGGGGGSNRAQQDLSSLFDRELRRQQQTNYETPRTAEERREGSENEALDKVRELARRQEQLARQQQDLARDRGQLSADELKRRLERLTRDQMELRRQAEQLAQQMARQQGGRKENQQERGQETQGAQTGQQQGGGGAQADAGRLREASEEMRGAAADLRRDDPEQARARSARALDRLRATERRLQGSQPDERRRALGDLQLEARQLAAQQRSLGETAGEPGGADDDRRRRIAGEQERLAERTEQLEAQVRDLATSAGDANGSGGVARAAREAQEQQLSRRMRDLARELGEPPSTRMQADASADVARGLERLADRLSEAGGLPRGGDEQRAADQLARAREARQRLGDLQRRMGHQEREAARSETAPVSQGAPANTRGKAGSEQPRGDRQEGPEPGSGSEGRAAEGAGESGRGGASLEALRREYAEQLREVERLQQEVQSMSAAGGGGGMATPEGQQMSRSAPGTEGTKQDFSQWEVLHKDVMDNLERLEASLSQQLLERALRDRLQAGGAESAPDEYQLAVERYFRSLAAPKP